MLRWFETRIEAFPQEAITRPPDRLVAFYLHYLRPVWPVFAALLVAGLAGALIEVILLAFVGRLVDLMRAAQSPSPRLTM
jgi:ATP-binding cassette subfamily B multidrug efflux pump